MQPSKMYSAPYPELLQPFATEWKIQQASWPNFESSSNRIDTIIWPSQWKKDNTSSKIAFRTADGTTYWNPALRLPNDKANNILTRASDWIFPMDEEHTQEIFSPEVVETAKRPDITICSPATKNVIIIELTVPSEENLANAYTRKTVDYQDLVAECENRGWTVYNFPVEIRSREIYTLFSKLPASLEIRSWRKYQLCTQHLQTVLRASYII